MLENEADSPTAKSRQFFVVEAIYILSIVCETTGSRPIQPGQQMEQGAFSAAGRSHNRDKIAGCNFKVYLIQGNHTANAATINF